MNDQTRAAMLHGAEALERLINRAERVAPVVSHTERQALLEMREALAQHPMDYDKGFVDSVEEGLVMAQQQESALQTLSDFHQEVRQETTDYFCGMCCCNPCACPDMPMPTTQAAPPVVQQGEWVDLTDEEILNGLLKWRRGEYELQIAYAAIHMFKEKNTPQVVPQVEPVAHMYPWDLERFQNEETFAQAFSIPVGCPDGKSVPLYTPPPSVEAAIEATKEKAARVCEELVLTQVCDTKAVCAVAIRNMNLSGANSCQSADKLVEPPKLRRPGVFSD